MLALALLMATAAPAAAPAAPAVSKLIDQLGDDDKEVRKAAEEKLAGLGEEVLPALLEASKKHPDVDVRLRVMVVARAIRAKHWGAVKALAPGAALKQYPPGGGYWFNRVRISKDGKYAVVGGGALILFEIDSGKEVGRVLEVGGARPGLDLSADGKYALTGHAGAADVHLVKIPSLKTAQTFKGHKGGVMATSLSADGKRAASVGTDATVRIWDVKTGKEEGRLSGMGSVTVAVFSPDGKQLLVGLIGKPGEELLRLFDAVSLKQLKGFKGHRDMVSGAAVLPGGKTAVASDTHGQVIVWDLESGKPLHEMSHGAAVNDLSVSADGRRAATAGRDARVKVWDLRAGKQLESFEGHLGAVLGVGLSADGRRAVSSDTIACVRVWKLGR